MNYLLQQAVIYHQQKNWSEAKRLYEYLLKVEPKNFDALLLLGLLHAEKGDSDQALKFLQNAVKINPSSEAAKYNLACTFVAKGDLSSAEKYFLQTLKINSTNVRSYFELAKINRLLGKNSVAQKYFDELIKIEPNNAENYYEYALCQVDCKNYEAAAELLQVSLKLNPSYVDALIVLGRTYFELRMFDDSRRIYDHLLGIDPHSAVANRSLANLCKRSGQYYEAMLFIDKAIEIQPNTVTDFINKGGIWQLVGNYLEAINAFSHGISIDADAPNLYGAFIDSKLHLCDWTGLQGYVNLMKQKIVAGKPVCDPFIALALYDSLQTQKQCTEASVATRFKNQDGVLSFSSRFSRSSEKIVVAYISADFRNHPISFLMAELFELHDRERFEIIGISSSPTKDNLTERLSKAFDQFIDVHDKSDQEIISILKDLNVDIAIDLGGYTQDSRFGVLAQRAAPIQMSYLGFLGTTNHPSIDYIIADEETIPPESQPFYSEKIAYLPSYQVNDSKRKASDRIFTKKDFGIPEDAFVYCCFNNNYKLMPEVFSCWMNILNRVSKGVLLLYAENEAVKENLKKEVVVRGVDPARLFFGERLSQPDYLARYRFADLFLDTFPYNAGTTASDALWMDVPVLTRQGETFASRVASSILKSIGLPELITKTVEEYESLACELGTNELKMRTLKEKLISNKSTTPLFDTPKFTQDLERLYEIAFQKLQRGEGPSNIRVIP